MTDVAKLEKQLAKLVEEEAETGKIINIVERVLAIKPSHVYALQCKAVCSITQEKFGSALEALELLRSADRRTETSPIILFQRAYCEYRMQHFVEARVILTKGRGPEAVANHVPSRNLLAQIHYNLEEYNEAAAEYRSLLDGGAYRDELERTELETNYTAALALAAKSADALNAVRNAEERTSDLLYNAACAQIEAKDYEAALTTLRQAEQLCAQQQEGPLKFRSLAEVLALPTESVAEVLGVSALGGATRSAERSFFNEVANVWVQIAFVQYALKREEEALATLRAVLLGKPSSAVVAAVASINWTAMMRSTDFFDSHRKLKAAHNTKVTTRLTSKQLLVLRYNTALLLLSMGNASGCRRLVEQLAQEHPNHELTISLQLALAMREMRKKKTKDDSMIEGYLANYESKMQGAQSSSMVKMISAQIYLEQGNLQRAIQVLSATDGAIAAHPTTIATITSWKLQLGQTKEAVEYLRAALTHSPSTKALLQWAIHFITAHNGSYREAAELLQHVRSSMADLSGDQELIALQALCLSHHDLAAARKLMQPMTGSDDAAGKASATSTTAAAVDALVRSIPSKTKLEDLGYRRVSAGDAAEEHKKGRKQRKMRRPAKHAEEGVRANPERWIPMSLRPSVKDLPERRKRELKRLRAMEQEKLRMKAAERRKAEAAAAAS